MSTGGARLGGRYARVGESIVLSEVDIIPGGSAADVPGSAEMEQKGFIMAEKSRIPQNKHGTQGVAVLNGENGADGVVGAWQHAGEGAAHGALADPFAQIQGDGRPTMLLIGEGMATAAIACWAARAGLRCVGQVAPEAASERLARTVSLDLILFDARGLDMAQRFDRASAHALAGRHSLPDTRLAVLTDFTGLDCAVAMLDAPETEFLCEPPQSDIVTLLVMAALRHTPAQALPLHDTARETDAARLERLSDEVRRLAVTIERMTQGEPSLPVAGGVVLDRRSGYRGAPALSPAEQFQPREHTRLGGGEDKDMPSPVEIRQYIRARRMRDQYLPADLFADPAWDMMLDLLAARIAGQNVSVSSLCIAAAVPPTTALRWIRQLTDRAVFARVDDPADGRRVFIELTDDAAEAVLSWVKTVRRNGGLLTERR